MCIKYQAIVKKITIIFSRAQSDFMVFSYLFFVVCPTNCLKDTEFEAEFEPKTKLKKKVGAYLFNFLMD